jgi:hypothetical protein
MSRLGVQTAACRSPQPSPVLLSADNPHGSLAGRQAPQIGDNIVDLVARQIDALHRWVRIERKAKTPVHCRPVLLRQSLPGDLPIIYRDGHIFVIAAPALEPPARVFR